VGDKKLVAYSRRIWDALRNLKAICYQEMFYILVEQMLSCSNLIVVRHYMTQYIRVFIILLTIALGIIVVRQEFGPYELGFLSEFNYIPFLLLAILTITSLLVDTAYFKRFKNPYHYLNSAIGLTFCLLALFKITQRHLIDNSKTILEVTNMPGATNVLRFEFKDTNRFRLTESDLFGQTIFYGRYTKQVDTLKITESNYNGQAIELPKTGLIKIDTVFWNKFDTMLVRKE